MESCPRTTNAARRANRALVVWGLLTLVSVASGCTSFREWWANGLKVGPNYLRPPAPVANDWIDAADARVETRAPDLSQWWTVFRDPALDALVQNAFRQNITLREAGFRVLQARAQRAIVVGEFFPQQQDMFGGYQRIGVSKANANTSFLPARFFDQWQVGFGLVWELDFWGRFRRAIEAADADLDASVEGYDAVLVTLLADVARSYVELRTAQQEIEYTEQNVVLQRQTLTFAEARFRGGTASELDVDQARSNLAQTEALIPQQRLRMRLANNLLSILLGMPPQDLVARLGKAPIPNAGPQVAVGIPAQLLARRPDVRRAERQVAAQSARIGVAVSELYPHIGIGGTLGWSSRNFSNLMDSDALYGNVGPTFQWNVLNYGRIANNIRLQDARLQELIATYQQQVLVAAREAEDGLARFLQSQEVVRYQTESVVANQRAVEISLVQYKGGLTDFNRVALLQQNLVTQQIVQTRARGEVALGLIEVYRALGGGWELRLRPVPPVLLPPAGPNAPAEAVPPPPPLPAGEQAVKSPPAAPRAAAVAGPPALRR
ncbi:MAG: TolC family protein [Pirellulales bacterium]|nr:TolC family protein [Pirellulales bacterium]